MQSLPLMIDSALRPGTVLLKEYMVGLPQKSWGGALMKSLHLDSMRSSGQKPKNFLKKVVLFEAKESILERMDSWFMWK